MTTKQTVTYSCLNIISLFSQKISLTKNNISKLYKNENFLASVINLNIDGNEEAADCQAEEVADIEIDIDNVYVGITGDHIKGINYTGNLSVIRTSPDHGTAYNLVGTNKVSKKSLVNCFSFIDMINKNRNLYVKTKKIIRTKLSKR